MNLKIFFQFSYAGLYKEPPRTALFKEAGRVHILLTVIMK